SDAIGLRNEIQCFTLLSESRHIIPFHGLVVGENPYLTRPAEDSSPEVILGVLTQYASKGSLNTLLAKGPPFHQRLIWGLQIAQGLRDIHQAGLWHGDLKSDNVVIDDQNNALIIDLVRTCRTYGW